MLSKHEIGSIFDNAPSTYGADAEQPRNRLNFWATPQLLRGRCWSKHQKCAENLNLDTNATFFVESNIQ